MNGYGLLEHTLGEILVVINPSEWDWAVRFRIINELKAVVESVESLRGATVEPFGSFASDLFTRWGDLDISIEVQNGSYIASFGKKQKQNLLKDVLKALRKKGGWRKILFISNARVPIVKFESVQGVSCDISICNLSGQMKSKMLFWINGIDGRFRNLVLLVKEWAKMHNINDSKSGTLNSYSLSLLVLFHLQTLQPAILPPLREIYPGNMIEDLTGVRADAENKIQETCAININRYRADRSRLMNRSCLSELFISFLAKFSAICSRASAEGISPHSGQPEPIDGNMSWLPKTYALFVEDPFEQPVNTARTVSSNHLIKISEAIQATQYILTLPNQIQTSILPVLVGPHISQSVIRKQQHVAGFLPPQQPVARTMPVRNHVKNGPNTHPRAPRAQPSFQTQHQFQNMRLDDNKSQGSTSGPVQASASRRRQTWRPRSRSQTSQNGSGSQTSRNGNGSQTSRNGSDG